MSVLVGSIRKTSWIVQAVWGTLHGWRRDLVFGISSVAMLLRKKKEKEKSGVKHAGMCSSRNLFDPFNGAIILSLYDFRH